MSFSRVSTLLLVGIVAGWEQHPDQSEYEQACQATATKSYSIYTYTVETSTRYATALPSPLALTTTWAPAFSQASSLLPTDIIYTSYTLLSNTSLSDGGQYGQSAYAALWNTLSYNQTIPFTTIASPTPLPSSELIFPPLLYYATEADPLDCYRLPEDFIWGVAGSAFQIEGGLKFDGRGPGALDSIGALPNTAGAASGEITNMNYFLYKQDIARLAAIGIPHYSFSISWTRIVPFGIVGSPINVPGLEHYDDLINTCIEYGVKPIVTLQHFDNPAGIPLEDPRYPDAFLYYAKQVMTRYGNRVQYWVTQNEPNIAFPTFAPYWAITNILMGHAKVYHWYKEELEGSGNITIKFANNLGLPLNGNSTGDQIAAQRYQNFVLGGMGNPIFLGQQYPEEVLSTPDLYITALTPDEIGYFNGTADFWSFDPYTSQFITTPEEGIDACAANFSHPLYPTCVVTTNVQSDGWLMGQASNAYAYLAPQYVRQQLGYVWNTFKPSGIVISEFGFNPWEDATKPGVYQRYDLERTMYYFGFLRETLRTIHEDGVNVIGALAWSFLDNNEFGSFEEQYGLQSVNRTDGKLTRSFKRSLFDYVDFFHQHVEG